MLTARQWRKHKTNIIFGGLTLAALAFSGGDISRNMQSIATIKSQIATNSEKQTELEQQVAFEEEQAKIAESRYAKGCLPIVAGDYPNIRYVSIFEGQVLTDRHTGRSLPTGTVVCDGQGNTGVVEESGVVGAIAFTGDRDAIAKRLKRFRGGIYSQPIGGN
ncbi:hypothetical protein [Aulosira sp. FACHB-615]|uniref:hypothetical protein n=1 Tax=Aulosira sp. FACHB-615 TaxID=2692777 RepID=UPI001688311F|nr:hypothetical protein [Aulosira sp. FACHB-615]MBD2492610.1 hypothetical protein [Aulosira sp. FACHB-615]